MNSTNKEFALKIGADPEVNPCNRDGSTTSRGLSCSSTAEDEFGGFGSDAGCREFRPLASNTPQGIVANLRGLMDDLAGNYSLHTYMMKTTSECNPLGGHIHLELPQGLMGCSPTNSAIVKAHYIMSAFWIPVMLSELTRNVRARFGSGYGGINDYRISCGQRTYEFRTPSSEWLTTPKVARATLAYCATVWHEIHHHPESFDKLQDIVATSSDINKALQELALVNYVAFTKKIVSSIRSAIKKFEYYEDYKEDIDFILNTKKVIDDKAQARYDMVRGWGYVTAKELPKVKRDFMSDKKLTDSIIKNGVDIDELENDAKFDVRMNNDANVEVFYEALKQRLLAYGSGLKNTYYIFGMRQGLASKPIAMRLDNTVLVGADQITLPNTLDNMSEVFSRMKTKARSIRCNSGYIDDVLDRYTIVVGIPYEDRVRRNTKQFLETVFTIEQGRKLKGQETLGEMRTRINS